MNYKDYKVITIHEKGMSDEQIKQGLRIQGAILNGECDKCKYLSKCESDETFEFPKDAFCMKKD